MARRSLNFNLPSLDRVAIFLHGGYGMGKTYLLGDLLKTEAANGPVRFLDVGREEGTATLGGMRLGDVGEHIETLEDFYAVCADWQKLNLRAGVLDTAQQLQRVVFKHVLGGEDRLPRVVQNGPNEWGESNWKFEQAILRFRSLAPITMVSCPSERSVDQQVIGKPQSGIWMPNLEGSSRSFIIGWFDFAFIIDAQVIGLNRSERKLFLAPSSGMKIRTRAPKPLPAELILPEGPGGWAKLYATLQEAFKA